MNKLSAKNKIFALLAVWIVLSALMFGYFFNFLDKSNQLALASIAGKNKDLAQLKAERESYKQAQADLDKLDQKAYLPESFFSQDISLVNEIRTLEDLSKKLNVDMRLSGISGTVNTAAKAKTITPIVIVPYSLGLTGDFFQIVDFVESLENLAFITNVSALSISAADKGLVNANLSALFYLKK